MRTLERRGVLPGASVAGPVTLVLGVLSTLTVAYAYVLSLADGVNLPDWARGVALVWLPVGLLGVPIGYYWSRDGDRQHLAEIGLALALAGVVALVGLVVAMG